MPKVLKKYNPVTKKWESLTESVINIEDIQINNLPITDNHIDITNPFYTNNDGASTLNDALSSIGSDIAKLQRNVSWLAEHGGGGGNGGGGGSDSGGSSVSYGIYVTYPTLENNTVYVSDSKLVIKFMITGGTDDEVCQYRYVYDDTYTSQSVGCKVNEITTITIEDINMVTNSTTHNITINATNSAGKTIPPVSFKIYESSLKIELNTTNGRNEISNNELLMARNNKNGLVYFDLKNALMGSTTVIKYSCNSVEVTMPGYINERVTETIPINIWDVIGNNVNVDDLYTVSISVQATLGNILNKTPELKFNVRITDPNEFTIYFDGITYAEDVEEGTTEPTEIEQSDLLKFTFKPNLPKTITNLNIYYAIRIISDDETFSTYLAGNSMDDTIDSIRKQIPGTANKNITAPQFPLNNLVENKIYIIEVKAWSYDGGLKAYRRGAIMVLAANNTVYPRQHNKRFTTISTHLSADTCLYAWGYTSPMANERWTSSQKYVNISDNDEVTVVGSVIPYNTNGEDSGFISSAEIPYLRLQNEAYAIADVSDQKNELIYMVSDISEGFTISLTFMCDEYADTDKTVCLFGENTANMDLARGIKVTLETVYWHLSSGGKTYILKAYIRQNVKNTIDFVYQPTTKKSVDINGYETTVPDGFAYIYVNGIVNAVYNVGVIDPSSTFDDFVYFGCDHYNGTLSKFADVNIYEFAIYTKALNPLQIVVNKKNAQLKGRSSDAKVLEDYQNWKRTNLIYNEEYNKNKALSYLIDSYDGSFKYQSYNELRANSPIPIIRIDANQAKDFTESYFHADYSNDKAVTGRTHACTMYYYDPVVRKEVEFSALIALQGTSTLGYYVKNLEIYVNKVCSYDSSKTQLFQPRADWFPEKQFTLKADIVDSSHANNATIGYWINNIAGLMENNPAMMAMTDEYRPKDKIVINGNEKKYTHISSRDNKTEIDFDENVTIKHNLEGFPVLLLIKFSDKNDYDLVGMYSFNLGRYSYYNMGMSFLKAFSRRDFSENNAEVSCPALIDYYEEYTRNERFGGDNGVLPNEIFSYEFGASADDNTKEHQTWTQSDITILQHYGDFNFNGLQIGEEVPDSTWEALSSLFNITASMSGKDLKSWNLTNKYKYRYENGEFIRLNQRYPEDEANLASFNDYISVNNAAAYFVIATAFGMIDSLGKNLTLRTWDGGKKWWTCFYDMDTALGLSNEGAENIPEDVFVDSFENVTESGKETILKINYHTKKESGYNAYYSKLWAILRDNDFIYNYTGNRENKLYEGKWVSLRKNGGPFDTHMNFVNLMSEHIGSCGELIYNYDYNAKYIINSSNISMLHGLRIEYVRNWLKNRFYFLDGVFENNYESATYLDSPFYTNAFNVTNDGHSISQIGYIPYTFTSTAPIFMRINTGNVGQTSFETQGKYLLPKMIPTTIHAPEHTSRKQTNFTSSSVLTQFEGLTGIDVVNMNTNNSAKFNVLPAITNFNIAGSTKLDESPIDFQKVFMYKDETTSDPNGKIIGPSCLETLNLSGTKVADNKEYNIDLAKFTKIKSIDISLSNVTSIALPNSILHELLLYGSSLRNFTMSNQPLLKTIDFNECASLNAITLTNCEGIENLDLYNLQVLSKLTIHGCKSLTSIIIEDCASLTDVELSDCPSLENVIINSCRNQNLKITLPLDALKSLKISNLDSEKPLTLTYDNLNAFTQLETLNINSWVNLPYIEYKTGIAVDELEMYNDCVVWDFSRFTSLNGKTMVLSKLNKLEYIRVPSSEDKYFELTTNTFSSSKNLKRVFGSIELTSSGIFNGKTMFSLNSEGSYSDINLDLETSEIEYVDTIKNPYFTNVKVNTKSLTNTFNETSVNIEDAIYILKQCSNVTNLESAFATTNVVATVEKPLPKNLFKYCTKVTLIDGLFNGCLIMGYLDAEILTPLLNIESFVDVFGEGMVIDEENGEVGTRYGIGYRTSFFPVGNKIKIIGGFNPIPIYNEDEESIKDPINFIGYGDDTMMFFQNSLLRNLDNLTTIHNSFNRCYINFTKNGALLSHTPKLSKIISSFSSLKGYTGSNYGLNSNDEPYISDLFGAQDELSVISNSFNFIRTSDREEENFSIYIGDSFFNNVYKNLTYIGSGYNVLSETIIPNSTSSASFLTGDLNKYIYTKDCADGVFPYKILEKCTKLTEITNFLSGLSGDTEIIYQLPCDMFKTVTGLTNICGFFSNMKLRYNLTSESFINNKIAIFDSVFKDYPSMELGKEGAIPYRLFYQKGGNYITNMKGALSSSLNYNIQHYTCSKETFEAFSSYTENNMVIINPYIYDGTVEFYDNFIKDGVIEDIYNLYKYIENGEEVPSELNKYIGENGLPLYEKLHTCYIHAIEEVEWYRTVKYKILKEAYQGNDLLWNEASKFNYFCPPDIFNYCTKTQLLQVDGIFEGSLLQNTQTTFFGYRGRIPEHIFDNLKTITKLSGIFAYLPNLTPHKNGYSENTINEEGAIQTTYYPGIMYPPNLFDKCENLTSLQGMFAYHTIYGLCVIKSDMFGSIAKNIIDVNSLFTYTTFINLTNSVQQIETGFFNSMPFLRNISNVFSLSLNLPATQDIFSYLVHQYINDVSYAFYFSSFVNQINVPEFWNWPSVSKGTACYGSITPPPLNLKSIPVSFLDLEEL